MNKYIYIIIYFLLSTQVSANNADTLFGSEKVKEEFQTGGNDFIFIIDNIFGYLIGLLYFISIVFAIYGGFTILTSGGDEEKVKKGKMIVLYMVLGLIVIFLGSNIVNWIIDVMSDENIVGYIN